MTDDILVRLRLAGEQFKRELDSAFGQVPQQAEQAGMQAGDGMARGISSRASAIGAAVGGAALIVQQAIEKSLNFARELDDTSRSLAVNVEMLQGLRHAAADAGISTTLLESGLTDLHQTVEQASNGNREAQETFIALGVGFQTVSGQARATDAVFGDVIDRLNAIEDPAERARVGQELLGDSYQRLIPLLSQGSAALRETTAEMQQFGEALSAEEIAHLEETNAKLEDMKNILSVRVASIVADNADSIINLANALEFASGKAAEFSGWWARISGNSPMLRNMGRGLVGGPAAMSVGGLLDVFAEQPSYDLPSASGGEFNQQWQDIWAARPVAPTLSPPRSTTRRTGGAGPRGGGSQRASAEDRAREQAIRAAQRAEEDFEQAVQRTMAAQTESARIEAVRKEYGDGAAAAEEARLEFQRQNPLAVHQTVEALAAALGITRELTQAEREHYDNLIASADAAEQSAERAAQDREALAAKQDAAEAQEKAQRDLKDSADRMRAEQEAAVRDLADLYEGLFTGGNGKIWKDFKQQGMEILADMAAQWTLALLSGQSGGLAGAVGGGGVNPLASVLSVLGGSGGTGKAGADVASSGIQSVLQSVLGMGTGGGMAGGASAQSAVAALAAVPGLGQALAIAGITLGIGEGIEKLTGLRFDMLGGLLGGGIGGFAVGAMKGAVKGNATIGANGSALGIVDSFGKRKFQDQAVNDATGVMDTLAQIAQGLGVDLNSSLASVSIGTRNGKYRVDGSGQGILKTGLGAVDFGKDQQAALEYAVRNLIEDGVLGPISAASKTILTAGGDLQQAIEKAVLIESVPRLLKERLDPLGAELDAIDKQFASLAEALQEGGASAEQVAEARKLWQLERADAIKQIGEASASLKEFLQSLNAGSESPLSLRQQRAEAEKALAPYVAAIQEAKAAQAEVDRLKANGGTAAQISAAEDAARVAAGAVDQGGFQNTAQLLLGISRQINGSGAGFFADFDRIRSLTGGAIGAIDAAAGTPGVAKDPFTELTARNTGDMATMLAETNQLLVALNDNFASGNVEVGSKKWLKQQRKFTGAS